MRSLVSISLSFLLLLQTVNFGAAEVLRLGALVEHAQLHSVEFGDSFLDFLQKHYGSSKADHLTTHDGHEKLPFNHDPRTKTTLSFFIFQARQVLDLSQPTQQPRSAEFIYTETYSSMVEQEIYQPPKMA